ncbi:choice-of-anchor I family protein [Luteirhabdus pelagi]|uniref:choice-of-anchor I family protein n=1 Tax=Luteirhabdus pelagi TaxID=2792783 RepID=UPI00193A8602|nr:choice-of-anchor I family protein [Luteirhabdus pelagi]
MKKITLLACLLGMGTAFSQVETVAGTSFEDPTTGGQYTDTGDANVAHDLINNTDEAPVDFVQVADEIGFDARYEPYDTPSDGLTDGDFVGVTDFTGDVGAYTDGLQGYQMSDTDGNMIVEFDAVDFDGFVNNQIRLDYYVNETGYEGDGTTNDSGNDRIRIYIKDLTNATEIDILNTEGSDINDLGIEGAWQSTTTAIPDNIDAQLVVELRSNSGSEAIYLDNIIFEGEADVPPVEFSITEIFSGQSGTDLTADWFEIENIGTEAWVSGTSPDLYYDDESADPVDADIIQGITEIQPGAKAIVLITDNTTDITTFEDVWSPVIDLTGVAIGYADGAGLGGGGDAVTLWAGDPNTTSPIATATYPDTDANDGQSYDVEQEEFSVVGNANGAVETIAQGGDNSDVPNIGSPGDGVAIVQSNISFDGAFTSISEDGTEVTITLTISDAPSSEATVDVTLVGAGTATEGTHFTFSGPQTVTFPMGSTDAQTITIPILDNSTDDSDLFFVLELENEQNAEVSGDTLYSVYILDDDTEVPAGDNTILDVNYLTSYTVAEEGTAEITAYDPGTQRLFVTNGSLIEVLDFSDPENIQALATVDVTDFGGAGVQSIAVNDGIVAAAVSVDPKTDNGVVVFSDVDGNGMVAVEVGPLPDMLLFSPDGTKVLVANEGEPNDDYSVDPEGSVSIIDVSGGLGDISQADVTTLNFNAFDSQEADLIAAGVRIFGPGATVSQDLEPEYIAVSDDSQMAYVTLQENNAYAIVDLSIPEITDVISFGLKDHSLPENSLDLTDETDFIFNASWPVKGVYMPDAIDFYEVNGTQYIVTANEGDAREYDTFEEERKLDDADYILDETVFSNIDILQLETNLGDVGITNASGDTDNDGEYEEIHIFGGRSFSIFEANTGTIVFDSGNDFEVITAADPVYGPIFNASNSNNEFKNRSDNKGPEPEGVLVQEINGLNYAFILLERIGGVMVYDVSDPTAPVFLQYVNSRDAVPGGDEGGDLGPEGIMFVTPEESPINTAMLVVSNEVSGSLSLYTLDEIVLSNPEFEIAAGNAFSMYPNPASERIYLSKPGDYTVYDLGGRLVKSVMNAATISVQELSAGTYIITNASGVSQKLIVK